MAEHLSRFAAEKGVVFTGRAQALASVVRTHKRSLRANNGAPRALGPNCALAITGYPPPAIEAIPAPP
jgi:hypothetical protein